jgi:bifunctional non-homologous end joining protein LigD
MVIDIDPSPKNKFTEVVDTALAVKMVLDKAGIPAYCKTSGASGLHVYVPMKNKYDYNTVKDFAHIVASPRAGAIAGDHDTGTFAEQTGPEDLY